MVELEKYTKIGEYYFLTTDLEESLKVRCNHFHESEIEEESS